MAYISERAIQSELDTIRRQQSEIDARSRRDGASEGDLVDIQARYDAIYRRLGAVGAPASRRGEAVSSYRARLALGMKPYSLTATRLDLNALDGQALATAEEQIATEVEATIADPTVGDFDDPRKMRRVDSVDPHSGQRVTTWHGDPNSWMNMFKAPLQVVTSVRTAPHGGGEELPWVYKTVTN